VGHDRHDERMRPARLGVERRLEPRERLPRLRDAVPRVANGAHRIQVIEPEQLVKHDTTQTGLRERQRGDERVGEVTDEHRAARVHRHGRAGHRLRDLGLAPGRALPPHAQQPANPLVHGRGGRNAVGHPAEFEVCVRVDEARQNRDLAQLFSRARRRTTADAHDAAAVGLDPTAGNWRAADRQQPPRTEDHCPSRALRPEALRAA